jgi:hypothetical protein
MSHEPSTPPTGPVKWRVSWVKEGTFGVQHVTAQTAFAAHRLVPGAPAFGECDVRLAGPGDAT